MAAPMARKILFMLASPQRPSRPRESRERGSVEDEEASSGVTVTVAVTGSAAGACAIGAAAAGVACLRQLVERQLDEQLLPPWVSTITLVTLA